MSHILVHKPYERELCWVTGKTNCVLRFVSGQFRENYIPTVEDTYRQVVSCNKLITTLQITDTYVDSTVSLNMFMDSFAV